VTFNAVYRNTIQWDSFATGVIGKKGAYRRAPGLPDGVMVISTSSFRPAIDCTITK
jgi:hypothetical protein